MNFNAYFLMGHPVWYLARCLHGVSNVFTAHNVVYDKQGIIVTNQAMGEENISLENIS